MGRWAAVWVLGVACGSADKGAPPPVGDTSTSSATDSADTDGSETGTSETGVTETSDSTAPCDAAPGVPGQDAELSLTWNGEQRTYVLHVPADYDCTPRPLVIGLHSFYKSGFFFEHQTVDMFDHIEDHGYIALFPDETPSQFLERILPRDALVFWPADRF